jgi:hypothetical protein
MFTMMNTARIAVGVQGLGAAEVGYQASLAYARERLQMRALSGPKNADGPADPIIVHPDVRRMLLLQKAFVEGGRALAYHTALQVDLAEYGATDETRQAAQLEVDFLTPVVKAFLTERGFDCVSNALQIFGGHGYIQETGIEQYLRDIRITLIYEGTTQIQALDLMGRKTLMNEGRALRHFVSRLDELAGECEPRLADMTAALRRIGAEWLELAAHVGREALADPEEVGAASTDFLMFSGYALLASFWARMALVADVQLGAGADDAYLRGKLATARFYMQRVLPQAEAHRRSLLAGGSSMMALDVDAFDHL